MIYTNKWTCPPKRYDSAVSPQKCTKLNTEKQNVQGHLGSNLTPEWENRNFRKTVIANSTKPLCRPRGHLSWQSHEVWCHCKIHQKSYRKKEGWGQIWPRVAFWGLKVTFGNVQINRCERPFVLGLNKTSVRDIDKDFLAFVYPSEPVWSLCTATCKMKSPCLLSHNMLIYSQ